VGPERDASRKVTIVEGAGRSDEAACGLVYDDASTGIGFGYSLERWTPERDLELRKGLTRFKGRHSRGKRDQRSTTAMPDSSSLTSPPQNGGLPARPEIGVLRSRHQRLVCELHLTREILATCRDEDAQGELKSEFSD
jgi:hypothetical protein